MILLNYLSYYLFEMSQPADYYFEDSKDWRTWLEKNHLSQREAWVIIQKKKSQKKGLKYEQAVEEAICFGWIDSKMQRIDEERFRQRFSPRRKGSIWSKKNKQTAQKMIQEQKMTEAGLREIQLAKENGKWDQAYTSKVEPQLPKDIVEALKRNGLAWENFNQFSNSTKFQYIHWVMSAKKETTRQRRILEVVKKANQNVKPR
jgi:uncharacterized protein YdeI (YjbR/CyaY-like superfamily)